MTASPGPPRPISFLTPGTSLASFAAVVVGAAQWWFAAPMSSSRSIPVIFGIALAISLSLGLGWAERHSRHAVLVTLGVSIGLAAWALWLSRGVAYVMLMPALSCVVLYLSFRWASFVALATTVEVALISVHRGAPPLNCVGETLGYASAVLFVCIFTLFAKRERLARREVERLSAEVEELAIARERNRIARELHDSLGHVLTVANVQLEAVRSAPEGREERLERVQALLKSGLSDLRRTVSLWRDAPMPEAKFSAALLELVAHSESTGLQVAVETTGTPRVLAPDVGFTLYRGAQEALTNVHRHAQATRVTLKLDYTEAAVTLRIADDGVGGGALEMGNGLRGLHERLSALGGTAVVEAVKPRGVSLTLRVPA